MYSCGRCDCILALPSRTRRNVTVAVHRRILLKLCKSRNDHMLVENQATRLPDSSSQRGRAGVAPPTRLTVCELRV